MKSDMSLLRLASEGENVQMSFCCCFVFVDISTAPCAGSIVMFDRIVLKL